LPPISGASPPPKNGEKPPSTQADAIEMIDTTAHLGNDSSPVTAFQVAFDAFLELP